MSRVKRLVELRPPHWDVSKEVHTSPGHLCGYCHGVGYFSSPYREQNEEPTPCPVCDGMGMVDAIVNIEWKPSKK